MKKTPSPTAVGISKSITSAQVAVPAKAMRSDGLEARNRLLDAALTLFAEKGFAKTSTREIALAAQVNIASISYYFGDKEGLYRAVFADPRSNPNIDPADLDGPHIGLEQALSIVLRSFVEPMKQGHLMQQCMKLHFREMLEPTGVWQEEIDTHIKPAHAALVAALGRHLGVEGIDDDLHRLAFAVSSLGMMLHVGSDVYAAISPQLINTHAAIDTYSERLTAYAMALVDAEAKRRAAPAAKPPKSARGKAQASQRAKATPKSPSPKRTSSL